MFIKDDVIKKANLEVCILKNALKFKCLGNLYLILIISLLLVFMTYVEVNKFVKYLYD